MAIGNPTSIGSATATTNVSSLTITTSAAIVAGNLVVVGIAFKQTGSGALSVSTVSDGTNTYAPTTARVDSNANLSHCELWYKASATAVGSGASLIITLTGSLGATPHAISAGAVQVTGISPFAPLDTASSNSVNSAATGLTTSTGTLSQSVEIVFGATTLNPNTTTTFTESSLFTNIFNNLIPTSGVDGSLCLGYRITNVVAGVSYSPTWTSSGAVCLAVAFRGVWPAQQQRDQPRYDYDPGAVWVGAPQAAATLRILPAAAAPVPSPVIVGVGSAPVQLWQWAPPNAPITPAAPGIPELWRGDNVPEPGWRGVPDASATLYMLTAGGKPFNKLWRWDHVPDPVWAGTPQSSDTLYMLTAGGEPFSKQWGWGYVPDQVWQGAPAATQIGTFPSVAPPSGKLWRWDILSDPIWYAAPVRTNIGTIPSPAAALPAPIVVSHGDYVTWWQGAPTATNIGTLPPTTPTLLGVSVIDIDVLSETAWIGTPRSTNIGTFPAGTPPFSKLWHYDLTPSPDWTWSSQPSDTLYLLTAGGEPFFHQWRYDYQADAVWQGAPRPTNVETFPAPGTPVYETIVILHGSHETAWWQGAPLPVNIETFPVAPAATPQTQFWAPRPPDKTEWQWRPPYNVELLLTPAAVPFSKLWRYDYQPEPGWQGAPVSVAIETFPAAGLPFGRLWRYDLTPSPDWTWQPPASGILRALTAGGAPTHLQWRYDYTPEPVWPGAPVSASYAALKESGKPFSIQWRYDWDSGQSWWQGAPIGVNVPIANPGPPVPVVPPTTGAGGERWPRTGYRWRWTDFNDRAWLKAFRDEFYRLRRLKNPERRRAQFEVLEQKFIGAAQRALEYETPYEKKLDLVQLGEMLQGFAAPASFDRIEMYLVALAAEIDDEEAFLLLND